jgi:hypothetical protein
MDKDDIDHALHGIRMMVQVAIDAVLIMEKSKTEPGFFRLLEPDSQTLHFSLFDVLKRVDELKAEQSATAAPDAGSDGQRSRSTDGPDPNWRGAYSDIESPLCDAVHMIGIASELANDTVDIDEQLLFAVNHSQELMEGLKGLFYKNWERGRAADEAVA